MDGTTGSMLIFCNDGGSNRFNFSWAHGASSIVGDPYVHGNAKVYFNDMPSRLVRGVADGVKVLSLMRAIRCLSTRPVRERPSLVPLLELTLRLRALTSRRRLGM